MPSRQVVVVVDTNVFGASLTRRNAPLVDLYASHLVGRVIVLAARTVAELRYGALLAKWGPSRRAALERRLARAPGRAGRRRVGVGGGQGPGCRRRIGHAMADDHHANDLWIAATALCYRLPLVAHDGVFRQVPGLDLRTELADRP